MQPRLALMMSDDNVLFQWAIPEGAKPPPAGKLALAALCLQQMAQQLDAQEASGKQDSGIQTADESLIRRLKNRQAP